MDTPSTAATTRTDALQQAAKAALERKTPEERRQPTISAKKQQQKKKENRETADLPEKKIDHYQMQLDKIVKSYPEEQQKIVGLWLHSRRMLVSQTCDTLEKTGYTAIANLMHIFYGSSDRLLWEVCDLYSDEVRTSYESLTLKAYVALNEIVEKFTTSSSKSVRKMHSPEQDELLYNKHFDDPESSRQTLFEVSEQLQQRACVDSRMLTASITRYMTTHLSKIVSLRGESAISDTQELFVIKLLTSLFKELIDQPNIDERLIGEANVMNTKMNALSKRSSSMMAATTAQLTVPTATMIGGSKDSRAVESGGVEKSVRCGGGGSSSLYDSGASTASSNSENVKESSSFSNCSVM